MLNDFIFSVNVVLPLFVIVFLGSAMRHKGFLDGFVAKRMNALVFSFALPTMLFRDVSKSDLKNAVDLHLLICAVSFVLLLFVFSCIYAHFFVDKAAFGSFVQGSFRSNYAIIGLPLIYNIMGGVGTGKAAVITTFVIPVFNILSVIVLSMKKEKQSITKILADIVKNPLIIAVVVALPFAYFNIKLPSFINTSMNYLASLATPLALLSIGASLTFSEFGKSLRLAGIASGIKLLLSPLLFVPLGYLMGLRDESLIVLFTLFATPTAVSSYAMADRTGNDAPLAANIIVLTVLGSVFTYTLGVFVLRVLKLIQ